jgi:hypothetical protein
MPTSVAAITPICGRFQIKVGMTARSALRLRNPLAISTVVVWRRSSVSVMCPMIEMCALVARAGAVRVSSASGRPSQAERSVGERRELTAGRLEHLCSRPKYVAVIKKIPLAAVFEPSGATYFRVS